MAHMIQHRGTYADDGTQFEAVEERPLASGIVGQVLVLGAAAVLILMGALALIRAGVSGDLSVPVVSVLGYTHTAWLGIAELAVGALLLMAGMSSTTRDLATALGVLVVVAAIVVRADVTALPRELAIERAYGWFLLVIGIVATVGGLLPAGWARRMRRRDTTRVA